MKKLLFILVAILSLCACSGSDDDSRSRLFNLITYDGKSYRVDSVTLTYDMKLYMYSGNYVLLVQDYQSRFVIENNIHIQDLGSSFFDKVIDNKGITYHIWDYKGMSGFVGYHQTYDDGTEGWGSLMGESSYVDIQKQGNQYLISVYLTDENNSAQHTLKASYLGIPRVVKD